MLAFKQTKKYTYHYDKLYGVGRFIRRSDYALSDLITGSDHVELMQQIESLTDSEFDQLAKTYEFDPELITTWY